MPIKKRIDEITLLPNMYFKEEVNYLELWGGLVKNYPQSSRNLPDELTCTMSDMFAANVSFQPHIPHWHQITGDDDARSLRNFLQSDGFGHPRRQSRNMDFLHYISMCLQYRDRDYRQHVLSWCLTQVFDEENDI